MDIVSEIVQSYKYSTSAQIDENDFLDCGSDFLVFTLRNNVSAVENRYSFFDKKRKFSSENQIIALFDDKSTQLENSYLSNIQRLANVMLDNPGYNIELIGHSAIEGDSEANLSLSDGRTAEVKNELIKLGIDTNRIKTKELGRQKPIYVIESSEYQKRYNRRVELRWLTPFTLPYEIHVGHKESENEAVEETDLWERRGYRVYYDRYMANNSPVYKIILWGYKSEAEAEIASQQIKKLYSVDTEIY
jgi:outer membrane protein OmpA-like peptidoglycan-associated protein